MRDIRLKARAKINLTLNVTGKREDGYHFIESIMQTVELYDGVQMQVIESDEIRIQSNMPWLPTDARNLAYRAAALMKETFEIKKGVLIELNKRIPVAAGLAGGSADCAAVLVGMDRLFGLHLSKDELSELAFRLGSDIPYCVSGGTVLAEGIGEILTPIHPPCPPCFVVLAKLPVSVSTQAVYQGLRLGDGETLHQPDTEGMKMAMAKGDIKWMGQCLGNVLESVTIPMYPKIAQLKEEMIDQGATGALMSGSGPTVFGLFEELERAKTAASSVRKKFGLREVFVTKIYHGYGERRGDVKS